MKERANLRLMYRVHRVINGADGVSRSTFVKRYRKAKRRRQIARESRRRNRGQR